MSDQNNLVWVNKKTNKIATRAELEDMWETPKHDFELKEIHQEEINKKTLSENKNNVDLKDIDLKDLIKQILMEKKYKKDQFIKYLIYSLIEIYFRKNISVTG